MLKNFPVSITPKLYEILYCMGHGDELVICDANFPAASNAKRLYAATEMDSSRMLELILPYFPLDTFLPDPAICMAVAPGDTYSPEAWSDYEEIIARYDSKFLSVAKLHRNEFYQRTREAYCVILTGERRRYGNIILRKGVIEQDA